MENDNMFYLVCTAKDSIGDLVFESISQNSMLRSKVFSILRNQSELDDLIENRFSILKFKEHSQFGYLRFVEVMNDEILTVRVGIEIDDYHQLKYRKYFMDRINLLSEDIFEKMENNLKESLRFIDKSKDKSELFNLNDIKIYNQIFDGL